MTSIGSSLGEMTAPSERYRERTKMLVTEHTSKHCSLVMIQASVQYFLPITVVMHGCRNFETRRISSMKSFLSFAMLVSDLLPNIQDLLRDVKPMVVLAIPIMLAMPFELTIPFELVMAFELFAIFISGSS